MQTASGIFTDLSQLTVVLTDIDCMLLATWPHAVQTDFTFMAGFNDSAGVVHRVILQQKTNRWSEITLSSWIKQVLFTFKKVQGELFICN